MPLLRQWVPYCAFISHKTSQLELLRAVTSALTGAGVRVEVAEWQVQAGRALYDGKIREQILSSDCMVVILTAEAFASSDVHQEIGAGWLQDRPIIAFTENGVSPGGVLSGTERIVFSSANLPEKLRDLVKAVNYWRCSSGNEALLRSQGKAIQAFEG